MRKESTMQNYKSMLAKSFRAPFSHKDWLFEVKWDGFRAIAYVNDCFSLKSRNGNELSKNFPQIAEIKQLATNVVLDGELIVMKNGRPDFQSMQIRGKAIKKLDIEMGVKELPATYVVFDILEKDGKPMLNVPLAEPKKILRESVAEGKHVCLSDYVENSGEEYYKIAVSNGLEEVVAKRKDSLYEPGVRSESWLKIKPIRSCDCVILGYTKGEGERENTFGSLAVGLHNAEGKLEHICNVSSGLTQSDLDAFKEFLGKTAIEEKGKVTYVKPLLVCEVVYQSVTQEGSLRAPRFVRVRFDKKPSECCIDQIKETILTPR
jgi:DNA ligase D-like protein (predicted ligase)